MEIKGIQNILSPSTSTSVAPNQQTSLGAQFASKLAQHNQSQIQNNAENIQNKLQHSVISSERASIASQFSRNVGLRKNIIEAEKSQNNEELKKKKQKKQKDRDKERKEDQV